VLTLSPEKAVYSIVNSPYRAHPALLHYSACARCYQSDLIAAKKATVGLPGLPLFPSAALYPQESKGLEDGKFCVLART
jgi:hypothetical protein